MSCDCETLPYRTRETYYPIIDSLGPFYDETILASIDRILYLFGVQTSMAASQKSVTKTCSGKKSTSTIFTTSRNPNATHSASRVSLPNLNTASPRNPTATSRHSCQGSVKSHGSKLDLTDSLHFLEHPLIQSIICPMCGNASATGKPDISKLQNMINDYEEYQRHPLKMMFKRPFTMAAQKLKKAFTDSFPAAAPQEPPDTEWFWTRRLEAGSHQVLEIYENLNLGDNPTSARLREKLSLILVVTPNGNVMPFEPVKNPKR